MRTRFDQFSKRVLAACLAQAGSVETERETSHEPQTIDLWFVPERRRRHALRMVPVLGSIARNAAVIEPFHQPPSVGQILRCVGKQQAVHQELLRANALAPLPTLWILSAGRPRSAIHQLGIVRVAGATAGMYGAPPGFRLRLVVLSELVKTRRTLILRLLGAGRTFREALGACRVKS
jgi:hypothetical protein